MPIRVDAWTNGEAVVYADFMVSKQLREQMLRHAVGHGTTDVPIQGLQLFRVTSPVPTVPTTYPACLCILVEGLKRVYLGGELKAYDANSLLCCTMPLPVEAEVPAASPSKPVVGMLLSLETPQLAETLVAAEAAGLPEPEAVPTPGLVVVDTDEQLLEAVARLLQLLDDPSARQVLVSSRLREVYFALLRSDAGGAVRRTFGLSRGLGRALAYLHEHIGSPISIEQLASVAGMSKAVFHRRFRAATKMSPLQFLKAIRLNHAAALIAAGSNVAEAAHEVGYESPSQFSREFRRHYRMPPRQWAVAAVPAMVARR